MFLPLMVSVILLINTKENIYFSMLSVRMFLKISLLLFCCSNLYSKTTGSSKYEKQGRRIYKRELVLGRNESLTVVNSNYYSLNIESVLHKLKISNWDIIFIPEVFIKKEAGVSHGTVQKYSCPVNPNIWGYYVSLNDQSYSRVLANMILFKSKLNIKINEVRTENLPRTTGDEVVSRKGIYIDLNIDDWNLILISTHLSWGTDGFTAPENINYITETVKKYTEKKLIFGGAMNTKAKAIKDEVILAGFSVFPVDVITVWDHWGWACSDFLMSNLPITDTDVEMPFEGDHNIVKVTYEIPALKKLDSNNFANNNPVFKNSLNN